ncbi:MAG: Uma2 family endonuclease [bacterium]
MAYALDKPYLEISQPWEEYGMSPVLDPHGDFCAQIHLFLHEALRGKPFRIKMDIFRYLDGEVISRFGDFKLGIGIDPFIQRLKHFGASKKFIQQKLQEFARTGTAQGVYAPDVFVVRKEDSHDRFSIPLVVFEVISQNSREDDLYFKTVFYETIGVKEYFIGEGGINCGTIIKAFRAVDNEFAKISPKANVFLSTALGCKIPKNWQYDEG